MAFGLFDKVCIEDLGITGTIVDTYSDDEGRTVYVVESHKRGYVNDKEAYNGEFPLYDRREDQLTKL